MTTNAITDNVPIVSKILIAGVIFSFSRRITHTCTGFRCTLNLNGQVNLSHAWNLIKNRNLVKKNC